MQKIRIAKVTSLLLAGILSACSTTHPTVIVDTTNLNQLEEITAPNPNNGETGNPYLSEIRLKALADTAMSLGAQGGLAAAYKEIDEGLAKDTKLLDTIYNFNGMMLTHGVLPPVLVQGDNSLNLADPDTIRIADKTYKIVKQARFATTPPNWREYLWQDYAKPEMPARVLLPRYAEERTRWRRAIRLGWEKGMQQAYSIFQQNLALLKRDYEGMILYRKLLKEHMVSPPFVSTTELGITGDGNDMRINDQVLRITEHPQLQTDSKNWKPIVVKAYD